MASICCQQKDRSFPLASLSDSGIQPSRFPAGEGVCFSENGEILDSDDSDDGDDDDLPSVSEILARARGVQLQAGRRGPVIDLACESDSDDGEVSWHRKASRRHHIKLTYSDGQGISSSSTHVLRPLPTSSPREPTHITYESPRCILQRPYRAGRNHLSRIDPRGRHIFLSFIEALSSLLPNLPHVRVALTRTMLSPF